MFKKSVYLFVPLFFIGCAQNDQAIKQSISNLNEEIINLQRSIADIKLNNDELERKIDANKEAVSNNSKAVSAVRNDMSIVTNELSTVKSSLDDIAKKTSGQLPQENAKIPSKGNNSQIIVIEDSFTDKSTLYSYAYELFRSGKSTESESKFKEFLALYPGDDLSDNAMYWIGEIYYSKSEYQKSINMMENLISKYPQGNKAPDAYFKIALGKHELGDKTGAIETLKRLIANFPDSELTGKVENKLKEWE